MSGPDSSRALPSAEDSGAPQSARATAADGRRLVTSSFR